MKFFKEIVLVSLLIFSTTVFAQSPDIQHVDSDLSQDFNLRFGFDITRKLYKGLSLTWGEEVRFKSNVTKFDRLYSMLELNYKVNPYFKTTLGYAFHLVQHDAHADHERYLYRRHRVFVDLVGSIGHENWDFSLRVRPLMTYSTDTYDPNAKQNPDWQMRYKFTTKYKCQQKPLTPYVAVELANTLNAPEFAGNYIHELRGFLGLKWEMTAGHELDFFYRADANWKRDVSIEYNAANEIQHVTVTHKPKISHIVGITYSFDWE